MYIYKTKKKLNKTKTREEEKKCSILKKNRATAAETYNYRDLVYLVQCCFLG